MLISIPSFVTITVFGLCARRRSVFVESHITLALIALCLFAFLTIGLYRGVRLGATDKDELAAPSRSMIRKQQRAALGSVIQALFYLTPPDVPVLVSRFGLQGSCRVGDDLLAAS